MISVHPAMFCRYYLDVGVGFAGSFIRVLSVLWFLDPVYCWSAFDSGAVFVCVVVAEGFDYFFVALHVFGAFFCCLVDGFSASGLTFK